MSIPSHEQISTCNVAHRKNMGIVLFHCLEWSRTNPLSNGATEDNNQVDINWHGVYAQKSSLLYHDMQYVSWYSDIRTEKGLSMERKKNLYKLSGEWPPGNKKTQLGIPNHSYFR